MPDIGASWVASFIRNPDRAIRNGDRPMRNGREVNDPRSRTLTTPHQFVCQPFALSCIELGNRGESYTADPKGVDDDASALSSIPLPSPPLPLLSPRGEIGERWSLYTAIALAPEI